MTTKDYIRELNRTEDGPRLRKFADGLIAGINTPKFGRVKFTYAEMAELFQRCDPTIDAGRFEELMQIADASG